MSLIYSGAVQWETQFSSPVVAMYSLSDSQQLATIPFTSVSIETLNNLMTQFRSPGNRDMIGETKLFPTLYVGEHEHGLFAVPSLVDKETMMISPAGYLQIEGPKNQEWISKPINKDNNMINDNKPQIPKDKSSVLLFGKLGSFVTYKADALREFYNIIIDWFEMIFLLQLTSRIL